MADQEPTYRRSRSPPRRIRSPRMSRSPPRRMTRSPIRNHRMPRMARSPPRITLSR